MGTDEQNGTGQKQAARTTIVGGQPPGNDRDLIEVPVGLETVMAMAAASDAFAQCLLADREGAVRASRVTLTATEHAILRATGDGILTKMITEVGQRQPDPDRRVFLEHAAAALVVLLGAGGLAACGDKSAKRGGSATTTPASAPPRPQDASMPADPPMRGMRPRPEHPPPTGSRPDPPIQIRAGSAPSRPADVPCAGCQAAPPMKRERPMRPSKSRGISPRRPRGPAVTGSRPLRDDDE